jgi:hypothetical protein
VGAGAGAAAAAGFRSPGSRSVISVTIGRSCVVVLKVMNQRKRSAWTTMLTNMVQRVLRLASS